MSTSDQGSSSRKRLRRKDRDSETEHPNANTNSSSNSTDIDQSLCKIFNDPIHGHIEVHEACIAIIDTPQFQRLRFIQQLGLCYFVYPGATGNRFEHSIGVSHLAGQMVRSLRIKQPSLEISDKDVLCLEIAGLCHDLGHGPYSHLFDGKFIPMVKKNRDWTHEKASLEMLKYLLVTNGLMSINGETRGVLQKHGLTSEDITFIQELIYGPLDGNSDVKGRPKEKAFLYEIISNKWTGIDVDKWDYFARDCHHLGIANNFDHDRYIKFARVLKVDDGTMRICVRDKEQANLYQMFYTRYILHRSAYQHKVTCAVENMVLDAFLLAAEFLTFQGKNSATPLKLSDCTDDMVAYSQLTDNILWHIYASQDPNLDAAKKIVTRIFSRKLYHCLDERRISPKLQERVNQDEMAALKQLKYEMMQDSLCALKDADFRVQIVHMDFGKRNKNPLTDMYYYSKLNPDIAKKGQEAGAGLLFPPRFVDNLIRVYCCVDSDEVRSLVSDSFHHLCQRWDIPQEPDSQFPEQLSCSTPEKRPPMVPAVSAGKGQASTM